MSNDCQFVLSETLEKIAGAPAKVHERKINNGSIEEGSAHAQEQVRDEMKKFGASIACDGWDSDPEDDRYEAELLAMREEELAQTSNDDTFWGIDREEEAATLILRKFRSSTTRKKLLADSAAARRRRRDKIAMWELMENNRRKMVQEEIHRREKSKRSIYLHEFNSPHQSLDAAVQLVLGFDSSAATAASSTKLRRSPTSRLLDGENYAFEENFARCCQLREKHRETSKKVIENKPQKRRRKKRKTSKYIVT